MTAIFIYCDNPSHPDRTEAITNFIAIGDGRWTERYTSRAGRDSGVTLVDDERLERPMKPPEAYEGKEVRSRYQFVCRRCRRSIPAREEKLFTVLTAFAEFGQERISLASLAAGLERC